MFALAIALTIPRQPGTHQNEQTSGRPIDAAARARIAHEEAAEPRGSRCEDEAPDRAGRYEGGAERQEGEGLRGTRRADELRKESQEEQRDFGIEHVGEDPLTERGPRPGACRCRVELGSCCRPELDAAPARAGARSEEHTSELQS